VRNFLYSVKISYLIERVKAGRKPSMQTKDLVLNNSCQRQKIKQVRKKLPHIGIAVFAHALIIETINLGDLSTFVIASKNSDAFSVAYFETDKQSDCFNGVVTSVYVVTHEEVVSVWRFASDLEELNKIVELAMNITANSNWAFNLLDVGL